MSELTNTTFDPKTIARRVALADRIERRLKWMTPLSIVFTLALGTIAISDLANRWLRAPRRIDVLFLVMAATIPGTELRQRRLARRLRKTEKEPPPTRRQWAGAFAKVIEALAFIAVVGYLLAGWPGALAFLVVYVVLVGFSLTRWHRARRRARGVSI